MKTDIFDTRAHTRLEAPHQTSWCLCDHRAPPPGLHLRYREMYYTTGISRSYIDLCLQLWTMKDSICICCRPSFARSESIMYYKLRPLSMPIWHSLSLIYVTQICIFSFTNEATICEKKEVWKKITIYVVASWSTGMEAVICLYFIMKRTQDSIFLRSVSTQY